jgi:hypothetical protein
MNDLGATSEECVYLNKDAKSNNENGCKRRASRLCQGLERLEGRG